MTIGKFIVMQPACPYAKLKPSLFSVKKIVVEPQTDEFAINIMSRLMRPHKN